MPRKNSDYVCIGEEKLDFRLESRCITYHLLGIKLELPKRVRVHGLGGLENSKAGQIVEDLEKLVQKFL